MKEEVKLNEENFKDFIKTGVKVIDFYADWCGPCKMLAPELDKLLKNHGDKFDLGKVNVDECEDLAREYRIMSIPCLYIFVDGEKKERLIGYRDYEELEKIILGI